MRSILVLAVLGIVVLVLIFLVFFWNPNDNSKGTVSSFSHIPPEVFSAALNTGKYKLLDVRTIDEYNAGHLKNAEQSDYYQTENFKKYLNSLNRSDFYLIYCRTGKRSAAAMTLMRGLGFIRVSDLAGGYNAWVTAKFPIEK